MVSYHISLNSSYPPENNTQKILNELTANGVAEGLKKQRGREFGFHGCGEARAKHPETPTHCERKLDTTSGDYN